MCALSMSVCLKKYKFSPYFETRIERGELGLKNEKFQSKLPVVC